VRVRHGSRAACVVRGPTNCLASLARVDEESASLDRTVTTDGILGPASVQVLPRPGLALDGLLAPTIAGAVATASSTWVPDPSARPQAAIDDDPTTAWLASPLDAHPSLTVTLARPALVSSLRIRETLGLGASRPLNLDVTVGGRTYQTISDDSGEFRFPATRTTSVRLTVTASEPVLSYDTILRTQTVLPIGISELDLGGAEDQKVGIARSFVVSIPCGFGPTIQVVGGPSVVTSVTTTIGALLDGSPATATSCNGASLPPGRQRILVAPSAQFDVVGLSWGATSAGASTVQPAAVTTWTSTSRSVAVPTSSDVRTLELAENANPGWVASVAGQRLDPVRVDGWRQAWLVPAGVSGTVELEFAPDRLYRSTLAAGAVAALLLLVLAAVPPRRGSVWATRPRSSVSMVSRAVLVAGVGAAALGIVGVVAALAALVLVSLSRRPSVRPVVAAAGVVVATAAACIGPWPAGTAWSHPVAVTAALTASAGAAAMVGALAARSGSSAAFSGGGPSAEAAAPRPRTSPWRRRG
jgi:arabinofuranan 3-O-arabinosyltransferase